MQIVTVLCSISKCKFKGNDGYYGICANPKLQKEYYSLAGGRVLVDGCPCAKCVEECGILPDTAYQ